MQTILLVLSPVICIMGLFLYSKWLWNKCEKATEARIENKYLTADKEVSNAVDQIIKDSSTLDKQQLLDRVRQLSGKNTEQV